MRRTVAQIVSVVGSACLTSSTFAFPPYRTTDAETAGADVIELRLGLLRLRKDDSTSERWTPLSRLNLGVGDHYEIVSELEYSPEEHGLDEGALGFKWANARDDLSLGIETLALLPVQPDQGGSGVESQVLTTLKRPSWRTHINAGFFYDPRRDDTKKGWRGSVLAEFPLERLRPGVELFARDTQGEGTHLQAGAGVIATFERIELRAGLHVGLNDAAPDLEASVWLSWRWQLRREN